MVVARREVAPEKRGPPTSPLQGHPVGHFSLTYPLWEEIETLCATRGEGGPGGCSPLPGCRFQAFYSGSPHFFTLTYKTVAHSQYTSIQTDIVHVRAHSQHTDAGAYLWLTASTERLRDDRLTANIRRTNACLCPSELNCLRVEFSDVLGKYIVTNVLT